MKERAQRLDEEYAAALRDHLAGEGEASLQQAYELGRRAIASGLGLVDMAALHYQAVLSLLPPSPGPGECARAIEAAGAFLAEGLGPFEMAYRGFREASDVLRRLNETLEEEAKRIAHALHDDAGQILVSAHLALESLAADMPAARDRLQEARGLLDQVEEQIRGLSHELRPTILDDLGLVPALEFLAKGMAKRAGIAITVEGPRDRRLPAAVETALYRIVKEGLANVSRHARASRARVRVEHEGRLARCAVKDDGKGFDVSEVMARKGERGLGLGGMRQRLGALGGTLEIVSSPGRGTELQITIPLEG